MDTQEKQAARRAHLITWARTMERAAVHRLFGPPVQLPKTTLVNGPRAGALELHAGIQSGPLLRALQADDAALLRQLVPWSFVGEPSVFMSGRRVRVEAGWPRGLAEDDIPLRALGQHPIGNGRWLVGRNEYGDVVTAALSDRTPHFLFSGTSGSGKTTALQSAVAQLAGDLNNRLVLIDAKHGASLRDVAHVRGMIGPLATDVPAARAALAWCVIEMERRYTDDRDKRLLVVIIDEVQEIVDDELAADSLRRLVVQGRGARVHVILATQHPIIAALGSPTVGRNIVGRLALLVADADASRVAVGGAQPRADRLQGHGDSYAIAPGVVHRTQIARLDTDPPTGGQPDLAEWPEANDLPSAAANGWPSGAQVGAAILSATRGEGRLKFQRSAEGLGVAIADNNKAVKLLGLARDTLNFMNEHDMAVCLSETEHTRQTGETDGNSDFEGVLKSRQTDNGGSYETTR
jgi:DNA polymerase III delta prime subunit